MVAVKPIISQHCHIEDTHCPKEENLSQWRTIPTAETALHHFSATIGDICFDHAFCHGVDR